MGADPAIRAAIVVLKSQNYGSAELSRMFGVSPRGVNRIWQTAKERGFDPNDLTTLKNEIFMDAPRSGRPKKQTEASQTDTLSEIKLDRSEREIMCDSCRKS